jgi:NADPH:quinone reductase-like Zn-dependent oxidoreductase
MRAVSLTEFGDAKNLIDRTLPKPSVKSHEVLIRVKAAAFNPIDYQLRQFGFPSMKLPVTLGFDVSGVVEARGDAVTSLDRGHEVFAYLGGPGLAGGYAEFVAVPHWFVAKKPRSLSFIEAASVPLAGLTALQCLDRAQLDTKKFLMVAGGAGGVGSWAIQIAKAKGFTNLVTTAGSAVSRQYLVDVLKVPARQIVMYPGLGRADLAKAAIAANSGTLFDVALDCVGGAMTNLCCDVVGFEGQVVSIVNGPKDASRDVAIADEDGLFNKSATFHFQLVYALAEYAPPDRQSIYAQQLNALASMIDGGTITLPKTTNIGPLSAATVRDAHRMLEGGHTNGKLVATVE